MSSHPRDKALAETEPIAASLDDHSEQPAHMSPHPMDKGLLESEATEAYPSHHTNPMDMVVSLIEGTAALVAAQP